MTNRLIISLASRTKPNHAEPPPETPAPIPLCDVVSSGRHPATGFSTVRASNNAFVHVANPPAIPCAFKANLGALPAKMLMMGRTDKHEMCRCPAYFCAGSHQFEVQGLCMFSANFEAMVHRGTDANPITGKTTVNALLHFRAELSHGSSPKKELKGQNTSRWAAFPWVRLCFDRHCYRSV